VTFVHYDVLPGFLRQDGLVVQDVLVSSQNYVVLMTFQLGGYKRSLRLLSLVSEQTDRWSPSLELSNPIISRD
jgi:hypothetical protein